MTEQVGNKPVSTLVLNLNIPLQKLFGWLRNLKLWAAGDWQLHHNNVPAHALRLLQSVLVKHQITQVTQPRFGTLWLLAFPKTKITFEREEISYCQWDSGKYYGAADGDWENCVRSQVPTLKGTEESLSYVQCFLYLVSSSVNVSIFHITWLDMFWTDLVFTRQNVPFLLSTCF